MKLFKAVATALALCAAFAAQARTLDEVKKDGKILIATEGQFAPFNFFNGTTLTGFEVEVAELVAKKMGLTIQWKTLGFDALLTGLRHRSHMPRRTTTALAAPRACPQQATAHAPRQSGGPATGGWPGPRTSGRRPRSSWALCHWGSGRGTRGGAVRRCGYRSSRAHAARPVL